MLYFKYVNTTFNYYIYIYIYIYNYDIIKFNYKHILLHVISLNYLGTINIFYVYQNYI